ncbi:hypothetical protein QBC34DRAFT_441662 [Podospora aff. communis PSN243]|uniref:GED domain-containing protein n=1 Tax=Podospora aff. communis PSN243 TaxID=3040156 RepID=A0AAV9G9D4_9PEZI|nr:hypothetical protein QBC34DRAFT_441662 [Podospora aff. communis PSN243]
MVQRELAFLVIDIEDRLRTHHADLRKLGKARVSPRDMRSYLIDLATAYHGLALDAANGHYSDPFFGGLYPNPWESEENRRTKRLGHCIWNLNNAFRIVLTTKGSRRQIQWGGTPAGPPREDVQSWMRLYDTGEPAEEVSVAGLMLELEAMAEQIRGVELPTSLDSRVALALFRDHSTPWEGLALRHCDLVVQFAKNFVEHLVHHHSVARRGTDTAYAIMKGLMTPYFDDKIAELHAKVSELVAYFKGGSDFAPGTLMLTGHIDIENMELEAPSPSQPSQTSKSKQESASKSKKKSASKSKQESDFDAEVAIHRAMAYYQRALPTFQANVTTLANLLVTDIATIFSPRKVHDMSDEEVTRLGAEPEVNKTQRLQLQNGIDQLRAGLSACRKHQSREALAAFPKTTRGADYWARPG